LKTFTYCEGLSTGAHHLTNERKTADLPLAVWPCAQRTSQWQRYERYLPESNRRPGKMLPELARRAVESYSHSADLVFDSMCGIGTTLVEASSLSRRAFGIELEPGERSSRSATSITFTPRTAARASAGTRRRR
jgi:hypothetical protein